MLWAEAFFADRECARQILFDLSRLPLWLQR